MQRYAFSFGLTVAVLAMGCAHSGAARASLEGSARSEALTAMQVWSYGQDRETLTVVEDLVRAEANGPDGGRALAAELASLLGDRTTTLDAQQFICRQLWIIGTEAEVDALAPLLTKSATTNMARYALEGIPGAAVDAALLEALSRTKGADKAGIVSSLGNRRVGAARGALQALTADPDPAIAGAAKAALDQLGS